MQKNEIFRREACNYQRQQWTGKVLLLQGISASITAAFSAFFIAFIVFSSVFFTYTRRVEVNGQVITLPHAVTLFAPQQGTVTHTYVNAGDRVRKGDRIYALDVSRQTTSGSVSGAATNAILRQMEYVQAIICRLKKNRELTVSSIQEQIKRYQAAQQQTLQMADSVKRTTHQMEKIVQGYEEYIRRGLVNKEQLNYQRSLFQQQQSIWQSLNNQAMQQELQLSQLKSDQLTRAADFDNQISQKASQLSALKQQLAESKGNSLVVISAQMDGVVESLNITDGQMVDVGSSMAQIRPTNNVGYRLLLWLPDTARPYARIGEEINIRFDAFPSDKFGQFPGKILSVSSVPASSREMAEYGSSGGATRPPDGAYYKAIAAIQNTAASNNGKRLALSDGLRAQSIVFLDERPLYQWLMAPLFDIKNSLKGPLHEP